jgi:hypothetical protein
VLLEAHGRGGAEEGCGARDGARLREVLWSAATFASMREVIFDIEVRRYFSRQQDKTTLPVLEVAGKGFTPLGSTLLAVLSQIVPALQLCAIRRR